jgi:hypothetical protein
LGWLAPQILDVECLLAATLILPAADVSSVEIVFYKGEVVRLDGALGGVRE